MSIFRSYLKKCDTIIQYNTLNNSQNPVAEISYGTLIPQVSRFIFDIDLSNLISKIQSGIINPKNIISHTLKLTNTIRLREDLLGKKSYDDTILRASSFNLDLFNINQDWDEGSGYEFIYNQTTTFFSSGATNWYLAKTLIPWETAGIYTTGTTIFVTGVTGSTIVVISGITGTTIVTGATLILGTQVFPKGNEDVSIDITDYINSLLITGTTGFTGTTYGLGLKFQPEYESQATIFRNAVAFFAKTTNSYFEPYVETIIDDVIEDDRYFFYLNQDNNLYLYLNNTGSNSVIVTGVTIYDYNNNSVATYFPSEILQVKPGIYSINYNASSDLYPDMVMFRDVWTVLINNRVRSIENEFLLLNDDYYFTQNALDLNNYSFNIYGIPEGSILVAGDLLNIKLTIRSLYPMNQVKNVPLDIEYRIFTTVGERYQINVIPWTSIDRIGLDYQFNLDTSWFIPQDYYMEIRLSYNNFYVVKNKIKFTIIQYTTL